MSFLLVKIVQLITGGFICFIPGERLSLKPAEEPLQENNYRQISEGSEIRGYRDIISYGGKCIAVGTGGRIDYINRSGERTPVVTTSRKNLNHIVSNDQMLVVAGDDGTILFSPDGQTFSLEESGTDNNINGLTVKNGLFIACADNGILLISKNGRSWNSIHLEVMGNIISLSANDSFCIGITDKGEIIRSNDGLEWVITNYNKEYSGYNKSCFFKKVLTTKNRIVIIGTYDDGSPSALFSSLGNVWTERSLFYYDDQGMIRYLTSKLNGITYDPYRDQFILACDNGEIFSLPGCTKCNAYAKVSTTNLTAIICNEDYLLIVGEDFSISVVRL